MIWGPVYCMPMFGGPCGPAHHCGANSSYAKTMFTWSNINCGLASIVSLIDQRNNGVPAGQAALNFAGNITNGIGRNAVAAHMQMHGNPMGNLINSFAGFFSCCLLKKIPTRCIEIFSGVILILLGCKVLYEHLSA